MIFFDDVTEERFEAAKYNDDRLARNLDLLFNANRSSFMTELSANAIRVHQLETEVMHNDSTIITFIGAYVPNWEQLREMLGKEDFIYVTDSKLCSYENLHTIDENGGLFITVVPRNFREVKGFLERVRDERRDHMAV